MTTKQIAQLANVSRSTVSRVINNYSNVTEDTRIKVQKVIDEYGYKPNHFARTLVGKTPNIIGVFIADINATVSPDKWIGINSPYNMTVLSVIINTLKEYNHTALVNIINTPQEYDLIEDYFTSRIIAGGIFIGFPYQLQILQELAQKYNIVLIDQITLTEDAHNKIKVVNTDNILGGYTATKHLISYGHTNILHVAGDDRLSSIERKQGYIKAMLEHNLNTQVIAGLYREDIAYAVTKDYLTNHTPSAIFAANDIMALGVIKALKELKLNIPENISIIGFDNLNFIDWFNLDLTTMMVSLKAIGKSSVDLLFNISESVHETCCPYLVERGSVKKINY